MKIAIIGAGPAGIMAAISASKDSNQIVIYEKNEKIGKKLFITGKGRCNITNTKSMAEIMEKVKTNKKFLFSSFNIFTNNDIMKLLESKGLKLKVERGDRVFPDSDKSSDVIKTFEKILKEKKVSIKLNHQVKQILRENGRFMVICKGFEEEFDKVIIATGGKSYPATGSTGDGYEFAKEFGHSIIDIKPSLVPILTNDSFNDNVKGLSLKNVSLNFKLKNKKYTEFGEMLFTGTGISGPIVLTASTIINKKQDQLTDLYIDLKPALDLDTLEHRLIRDISNMPNKNISSICEGLTLKSLASIILEKAEVSQDTKAHQITKIQRKRIVQVFKHFDLRFKSLDDIKYAIITSGGINTKEIDPSTMQSKLIDNLFFAGEAIDVDATTGGYNLQIAYSTGYLAGLNAGNGGNNV